MQLEKKIQELIGGSAFSSPEEVADQLKQAAQKCYEALKAKLAAEARAAQAKSGLDSATKQQDEEDLVEDDAQLSAALEAASANKRPAEEKQGDLPSAEAVQVASQGPELKRSRDKSPEQQSGKGQPSSGKGVGKCKKIKAGTSQG